MTALGPVVMQCGGLWIGWPGSHDVRPLDEIPEPETPGSGLKSKQVKAVLVRQELFDSFYNGCCNGTFWPLFHSMPDRAVFSSDTWKVSTPIKVAMFINLSPIKFYDWTYILGLSRSQRRVCTQDNRCLAPSSRSTAGTIRLRQRFNACSSRLDSRLSVNVSCRHDSPSKICHSLTHIIDRINCMFRWSNNNS